MAYEIDFLPVGDKKSGDAIVLRYGNLSGSRESQRIVVIDGGFVDDGDKVVDHIQTFYKSASVDLVVSTHPDNDHVGGLKTVIDNLEVGELWMHLPANHSAALAEGKAVAYSNHAFSETLTKSLQGADDLEARARAKGIRIREPFAGVATPDRAFVVLGPTTSYYEQLLARIQPRTAVTVFQEALRKAAETLGNFMSETLFSETLTDAGDVSPVNSSSAICLLTVDGDRMLFTADAGIEALTFVADTLEAAGMTPGDLKLVQIPHHGSRRNVGPTVLNRLLGPIGQADRHSSAVVSAAPAGEPKHPAKKVTNAFRRRGYGVFGTIGQKLWHHSADTPMRAWPNAIPIPFYDQVDHSDTE
jgi:beta-lactamase superfamily II metal-dependent hydrolase